MVVSYSNDITLSSSQFCWLIQWMYLTPVTSTPIQNTPSTYNNFFDDPKSTHLIVLSIYITSLVHMTLCSSLRGSIDYHILFYDILYYFFPFFFLFCFVFYSLLLHTNICLYMYYNCTKYENSFLFTLTNNKRIYKKRIPPTPLSHCTLQDALE